MNEYITPREFDARFQDLKQEIVTMQETQKQTNELLISLQRQFNGTMAKIEAHDKWISNADRWKWKLVFVLMAASAGGGASISSIAKKIAELLAK